MNPRTILFIHQAFPGQFGALARSLAVDGHRVFALALNPQENVRGVRCIRYLPQREQNLDGMPPLNQEIDAKLIRAESVFLAMKSLKERGLEPDIIYVHPGWGEGLFVRDVWPDSRYVAYAEWYYHLYGQEVNFDPALPPMSEENALRLTLKNTPFLHALSDCDMAIAPTEWQKSRYPEWAQKKIHVIHDGLDLEELSHVRPRPLGIPSQGLRLAKGMPIVTFCARHLEPVRGFHYFMRALPEILNGNPDAHVIIMGRDAGTGNLGGYGSTNPQGESWRKTLEQELGDSVDWRRVHFLGMLERKLYLSVLKLSACHVYLTTPFILSWSFLEAAALGLNIVASDTQPVREFTHLGGIELVGFDDTRGIAARVLKHLNNITPDYDQGNLVQMEKLNITRTIPAIKELLLAGTPKKGTQDAHVEDIIILEEDSSF